VMVNAREKFGTFLLVVAIGLGVFSLSTKAWVDVEEQYSFDAGVRTFSYSYRDTSINGDLSDLAKQSFYGTVKNDFLQLDNLNSGGTLMLVFGSLAFVLSFIAFIMILASFSTSKKSWLYLGVLTIIVSGLLIVFGLILYSNKLGVGYSYILFLASTLVLLFAVVCLGASWMGTVSRSKQVVAMLTTFLALILIAVAMATTNWYTQDLGTGELNIGLMQCTLSQNNNGVLTVKTESLDSFVSTHPEFKRFADGGKMLLGIGIGSCVGSAFGVVCLLCVTVRKKERLAVLAIVTLLLATVLNIVGIIVYAKKLYVSYSFMISVAVSFLFLLSALVLLAGATKREEKPVSKAPTPDDDYRQVPSVVTD